MKLQRRATFVLKLLISSHGPEEEHEGKWWGSQKKALVKTYKVFLFPNWVTTYKNVALMIKCCDGFRKDCLQIRLTVQVDLSWCL